MWDCWRPQCSNDLLLRSGGEGIHICSQGLLRASSDGKVQRDLEAEPCSTEVRDLIPHEQDSSGRWKYRHPISDWEHPERAWVVCPHRCVGNHHICNGLMGVTPPLGGWQRESRRFTLEHLKPFFFLHFHTAPGLAAQPASTGTHIFCPWSHHVQSTDCISVHASPLSYAFAFTAKSHTGVPGFGSRVDCQPIEVNACFTCVPASLSRLLEAQRPKPPNSGTGHKHKTTIFISTETSHLLCPTSEQRWNLLSLRWKLSWCNCNFCRHTLYLLLYWARTWNFH